MIFLELLKRLKKMTTTIQVPTKTIPKIWNLDIPKNEEFINITITIPEEDEVVPDKEVDAQIANGECISFENAIDYFQSLNKKLDATT